MPPPLVLVRRHGAGEVLAELVLDRPERLNAISTQLAAEVTTAARELGDDEDLRAVVVTSSRSRAFCVGADLKERAGATPQWLLRQREVFRGMFDALRGLPVPAVAAVCGAALGGGLEIALCCDLILLDDTAVLGLPEVGVGLVPGGGGTQLLARRVGRSRAGDLLFTARRVGAAEAFRLGIADRLVPAGTARQAGLDLAFEIAGNSPTAVRLAKRALLQGLDLPLREALDVEDAAWRTAVSGPDRAEGIEAFVGHRAPRWRAT